MKRRIKNIATIAGALTLLTLLAANASAQSCAQSVSSYYSSPSVRTFAPPVVYTAPSYPVYRPVQNYSPGYYYGQVNYGQVTQNVYPNQTLYRQPFVQNAPQYIAPTSSPPFNFGSVSASRFGSNNCVSGS